jgi:hypothetical protein
MPMGIVILSGVEGSRILQTAQRLSLTLLNSFRYFLI